MNRDAFLAELEKRLAGLPPDELEERIAYYREVIDDRVAAGVPEEAAVAALGPADTVVSRIMSEIPLTELMREKKRKRTRKGWQKALLIIGFPVWFPLLISAAVLLFSLYIVVWSLVLCVYATDLALAAGAVGCLLVAFAHLRAGNAAAALFFAGGILLCAGAAILMAFASVRITLGMIRLTGKMLTGIKTSFVGKEG